MRVWAGILVLAMLGTAVVTYETTNPVPDETTTTTITTTNCVRSQTIASSTTGVMGGSDGEGIYFFGNLVPSHNASAGLPASWVLPANTIAWTSFTITQSLNNSLSMFIYLLGGQQSSVPLDLGLYVNGVLTASNSVETVANEASTQSYGVSLSLSCSLQAGTSVTMSAYAGTSMQIVTSQSQSQHFGLGPSISSSAAPSYDASSPTAFPETLPGTSGGVAVPSLSIQGEGR
jgi:hypothetical protein